MSRSEAVPHPVSGRWYDRFMLPFEFLWSARLRRRLLAGLEGSILEVGVGTGLNLPWYRDADRVVALDPDIRMMHRAPGRAAAARVPVSLLRGDGQQMPFSDDSFDMVVASLVFCSIPDPHRALQEVERVVRPEGRILLVEHVRSPWPWMAWLQEKLTPTWERIAGGCQLDRPTLEWVTRRGWHLDTVTSLFWGHVLILHSRPPSKVPERS